MSTSRSTFRDFGILPANATAPQGILRCSLSTGQMIGQYLGTVFILGMGLGLGFLFAREGSTANWVVAGITVAGCLVLAYFATRNDYSPIELDGTTLRARHLYTRRVVERSIEDIEELRTHVFQLRSGATLISEALTGVIRAIEIRFRDGTRFKVSRADPAMAGAQALIEGIVYRMSQAGEIVAVLAEFNGKPIVRRIVWKTRET